MPLKVKKHTASKYIMFSQVGALNPIWSWRPDSSTVMFLDLPGGTHSTSYSAYRHRVINNTLLKLVQNPQKSGFAR